MSRAKLKRAQTLFQFHDSQSLYVREQLEENQGKHMILRDQYEDLLCEQKYHDHAVKLAAQKLKNLENAYKNHRR